MGTWVPRLLGLAALGLLALGGYLALCPSTATEAPFRIDEPDRDLGAVPIGEHELVFRITNPTSRPRRIIGLVHG